MLRVNCREYNRDSDGDGEILGEMGRWGDGGMGGWGDGGMGSRGAQENNNSKLLTPNSQLPTPNS